MNTTNRRAVGAEVDTVSSVLGGSGALDGHGEQKCWQDYGVQYAAYLGELP